MPARHHDTADSHAQPPTNAPTALRASDVLFCAIDNPDCKACQ